MKLIKTTPAWALAMLIPVALFLVGTLRAADKRQYKPSEMPAVMVATYGEKVINNDAEKEVFLSMLRRGQLIVINEHAKKTKWLVTAGVLVNAAPETLFKVITDIDNYQKFMPMTEGAKVTRMGDPNIVDLNLTLKLKIVKGIPAIPMNYSVLHYHRPPYRSDWTYLTGRFESNDGFYEFVPVNGGKKTMAFYTIYSLPRLPVATNLFEKDPNLELVMNMSTAVMVTRALKDRAETIEKAPPFVPGKGMKGTAVDAMTSDAAAVKLLLSRGGLIIIEDGNPMYATTAVSIDMPPPRVYQFLTDFDKQPCYLSQVREAETLSKGDKQARASFELKLDYAILTIPLKYELQYKFTPPTNIEWKWAKGDLPSQRGEWTLFPLDGGKKTLGLLRQTEDLKTLPGMAGSGLKASIEGQPSLEPAIMGSQALILARSTRNLLHMSPKEKTDTLSECK